MARQTNAEDGGGRRRRAAISALLILGTALFIMLGALFIWRGDIFTVFLNKEGISPSEKHLWYAGGLIAAFGIVAALMTATFDEMREDVGRRLEMERAKNSPPSSPIAQAPSDGVSAPPPAESGLTPKQHMVAAYSGRLWKLDSRIGDDANAPEVWVGPTEPDEDGWKRTDGVVIYSDGSASQFSALVLTKGDVWALGSEQQILRQQINRPVAIKTVLGKPLVRRMISTHTYVLGVGLASSSQAKTEERNDKLSMARGYNLAYAVLELKLKEAGDLGAASFGHATVVPKLSEQEPLQRSVVLVGVNALRKVVVADIMNAVARLIHVDGVVLSDYTHAGAGHLQIRHVAPGEGYLTAGQVNLTGVANEPWELPARTAAK